jgi:hypothetical protein
MRKQTQSTQPQLSLLARYECAPMYDITRSPEQRRELVRSLAELLLQAANRPTPADGEDEEACDE